jgi:hypothetical protein
MKNFIDISGRVVPLLRVLNRPKVTTRKFFNYFAIRDFEDLNAALREKHDPSVPRYPAYIRQMGQTEVRGYGVRPLFDGTRIVEEDPCSTMQCDLTVLNGGANSDAEDVPAIRDEAESEREELLYDTQPF